MQAQIILHSPPEWVPGVSIQATLVSYFFSSQLKICMPRFFSHSLLDWTICVTSNKQLLIHFYCVSQGYAFLHHMILWVHVSDKISFFGCPIFSSMFPKSTHETLSQKLYEKFKNHKRFAKPKLSRTAFTIQHYAGDVSIFNIIMTLTLFMHLPNWIHYLNLSPGDISIWSFPGQKQRLCGSRTCGIT
jgi:hypothetical protein